MHTFFFGVLFPKLERKNNNLKKQKKIISKPTNKTKSKKKTPKQKITKLKKNRTVTCEKMI